MLAGLLVLQCLDIASGIAAAGSAGRISSKVGWRDLTKKVCTWIAIALIAQVETLLGADFQVFGLEVVAFRFFNVFGPLQRAGHAYAAVVPAFVDAALAGG